MKMAGTPRASITGIILAGGMSRRLGRDKASLPLAGKPLALWVAEALSPLAAEVWLITNQPLIHVGLGLPLLTDLVPSQGPLGGLCTGLFYARTPWVLAAAADSPFVSSPLLSALIARAAETRRSAVVCRSSRGLEPFPGLYSVRLIPRLTEFLRDDRRLRIFVGSVRPLEMSPEEVAVHDPQELSFLNLNTPEELEEAARYLQDHRHAPGPFSAATPLTARQKSVK